MEDTEIHFNQISGAVVDSAMQVRSELGPGLLESVYLACLVHELHQRGFRTAVQVPLPVIYDGVRIDLGFRLDIVVEDCIVVGNQGCGRHFSRPPGPASNLP